MSVPENKILPTALTQKFSKCLLLLDILKNASIPVRTLLKEKYRDHLTSENFLIVREFGNLFRRIFLMCFVCYVMTSQKKVHFIMGKKSK